MLLFHILVRAEEETVELLLKKDIEKLGRRGEIVKVADGYARNYLVPKGFAVAADQANLQQIEIERKRLEKEEKLRLSALNELAEKLKGYSCTISTQANEEGHLFGSINAAMIRDALAKDGFSMEEKQILLENPIKEVGVYTIAVQIEENIRTEFKLWVVAQ